MSTILMVAVEACCEWQYSNYNHDTTTTTSRQLLNEWMFPFCAIIYKELPYNCLKFKVRLSTWWRTDAQNILDPAEQWSINNSRLKNESLNLFFFVKYCYLHITILKEKWKLPWKRWHWQPLFASLMLLNYGLSMNLITILNENSLTL